MFWAPAPRWKREVNAWLFERIMRGFSHPRRTVQRTVDLLVARHPKLEDRASQLVQESVDVAGSLEWQTASYSRKSLRWTFEQFDRFPELHRLQRIFPMYVPRSITKQSD